MNEFMVVFDQFGNRDALPEYIEKLNAEGHRVAWLGDRRLRIIFTDREAGISGS